MLCPKCKKRIKKYEDVCPHCGYIVSYYREHLKNKNQYGPTFKAEKPAVRSKKDISSYNKRKYTSESAKVVLNEMKDKAEPLSWDNPSKNKNIENAKKLGIISFVFAIISAFNPVFAILAIIFSINNFKTAKKENRKPYVFALLGFFISIIVIIVYILLFIFSFMF